MKVQFIYTQISFFYLLGIKISKSMEAAHVSLRMSFGPYMHSRNHFVLMPRYEGLRSKETSLDFLVRHKSQFNLVYTFLVAVFSNDSNESADSLEMCTSALTSVKSTAQKRHIIKSNVSSETIFYGTFHQNLRKHKLQKHFSVYGRLPLLIKYFLRIDRGVICHVSHLK